jgi:hypothetical protein
VVNDPAEAALRAARGQHLIRTAYAPEAIGRRIRARLEEIGLRSDS